jgi:hypothetical protein
MNRDEADRALAALGASHDRVASAMYAIDSHPGLAFLRSGGLTGRTEEIWNALRPEVDARWSEFAALGDALEQARTIRSTRRPADPSWAQMQVALAVDIPRVAAGLESGCATIVAILVDVDACWTASGTVIAPVTEAMTALTARANDVGDTSGIAPLDRRTTLVRDQVLADPLSAAPGGTVTAAIRRDLTALTADIRTASSRLAAQARVRDAFPQRIAALMAAIDAVEVAEAQAGAAFTRADEKIASAGLPEAPHATTVLRARVVDLDARHASHEWRRLADDVATIEASIARAHERAVDLTSAADGLLARRDELRGRLEAYRAKAASHRLDEHDTLSPLHTAAHTLLYSAPCDLRAATHAVVAYQASLADLLLAGAAAPKRPDSAPAQEDIAR